MTHPTIARLPGLDELLHPGSLSARLAALADERGAPVEVRPFYVRWKPRTSALLGVRVAWRTAAGVVETLASLYLGEAIDEAVEKAGTLRLLEPALGPALARLDDALYLAFPNDRALRGLSAAADPRRVVNRIAAVGSPFAARGLRVRKREARVRPVRWKPGRRAVLELDLTIVALAGVSTSAGETWRAFARVLPAAQLAPCVARWRVAAGVPGLETPGVSLVDAERGWFATPAAPGRALAGEPDRAASRAIAQAITSLHAAPAPELPTRDDSRDLAAALKALEALSDVALDLAPRARALARRLAGALERLAPPPYVLTHGDMGLDQMLVDGDRVTLIDWDEAANGDPHADWASLLADARSGDGSGSWVLPLAEGSLGASFDPARLAWQVAAAEGRRVLEALQRGRAEWRLRALDGLEACERALAPLAPAPAGAAPRPPDVPSPARETPVARRLAELMDPARRPAVPGVDANASRVAAVWPDGEGGAIVRLERAGEPGVVVRWLRLGDAVEALDFPRDPGLPALAALLAGGRYALAGHRLGRRAALRERSGERYLYLRRRGNAERAFRRVSDAYARLATAGIEASRPLALDEGLSGWWAEAVAGRTPEPAREDAALWEAVGELLARVHATEVTPGTRETHEPGPFAPPACRGLEAATVAARAQLGLVSLVDPELADELDRELRDLPVDAHAGRPAWIHGDLHPLQILAGPRLAFLDWERACAGEAEEDLGNLLAHLAWESSARAREAGRALLAGYSRAGGVWGPRRLAAHAMAAMVRVRAVHSWRDGGRPRARDTARWRRWKEAIASC